ncbi:Uncharacterized membrane protein [Nakamurella panacisegetis]|uniref:Uncharacterized membrane protein n=1 Tax=Nakamurella panacisegetis TaxID=1090615 RepID=A0A1H0QTW4_9ACTN|nr:vitamin K epoxide reductase family protein [Nakamurella panacisegetis]SDP20640.1 Uncharacterized membrane protein [Nakamurella panacisegetis]
MTQVHSTTRSRPQLIAFGLSIAALLISAYLTYEHFTGSTTLACSGTQTVNCLKVTTSQWSVIAGVPVAVAGLAFFVVMTLLCAPTRFAKDVALLRLLGVLIGTASVLWLVYVELFKVDAICLWCTAVHVVTLSLLGVVLWWRETDRA